MGPVLMTAATRVAAVYGVVGVASGVAMPVKRIFVTEKVAERG